MPLQYGISCVDLSNIKKARAMAGQVGQWLGGCLAYCDLRAFQKVFNNLGHVIRQISFTYYIFDLALVIGYVKKGFVCF